MDHKVQTQLRLLGIPNARFKVEIERMEGYDQYGSDEIRFLFSANKQVPLEEISRVASGGEVSRLMLCIKSLVSDRKGMPTLIFDEIDAGVSGEIADKVGGIMDQLSNGATGHGHYASCPRLPPGELISSLSSRRIPLMPPTPGSGSLSQKSG